MTRGRSSGMTLIEWIVVVLSVVILLALLMPTVSDHRPRRRHQCSVNLKNLALASIQYENAHGEFPGYLMDFGTWTAGPSPRDPSNPDADASVLLSHRKLGTWAVALLPWLDAQPTYEHWTVDRYPIILSGSPSLPLSSGESGRGFAMRAAPNLAIYQCPSDPCLEDASHGRNSYICNAGMYHRDASGRSTWQIDRAGELTKVDFTRSMAVANGVFNNKFRAIGGDGSPVPVGPKVKLDDLSDGMGSTMLFSENLQALPWHRAGFIDAGDLVIRDASSEIRYPETSRYAQGMVWHFEDQAIENAGPVLPVHKINGSLDWQDVTTQRMNKGNAAHLARPSSAHVGGVHASMADGSTRFLSETIDYRVYQALLTPCGERSDVPYQPFRLHGDSLDR